MNETGNGRVRWHLQVRSWSNWDVNERHWSLKLTDHDWHGLSVYSPVFVVDLYDGDGTYLPLDTDELVQVALDALGSDSRDRDALGLSGHPQPFDLSLGQIVFDFATVASPMALWADSHAVGVVRS